MTLFPQLSYGPVTIAPWSLAGVMGKGDVAMRSSRFDFLEIEEAAPPAEQSPIRSVAQPLAGARLRVVEIIGGPGEQPGQFQRPAGLCVDPFGNLYVADSYNHRIQKITPAGRVSDLGRKGQRPGEFLLPQDVAVDPARMIYVLDAGNHRVQRFAPDGAFLSAFGQRGTQVASFLNLLSLAVDRYHNVYVADTGNGRVQKFTATGRWEQCFGGPGRTLSDIRCPQGVAVRDGGIYVADAVLQQVLKLNSLGATLATFGEPGQLSQPQAVAVDEEGAVYVLEGDTQSLQKFDPEGRRLLVFDNRGSRIGPFAGVSGLAVAPDGSLYVADARRHHILKIVPEA